MVARSGLFAGQVGALIRLDTQDDTSLLAVATRLEIHYKLPESGAAGTWTATPSGTKLTYTTTDFSDLPEVGKYQLQAYIEGPGWAVHGRKVVMLVEKPLIYTSASAGLEMLDTLEMLDDLEML
jgi:hypothetical protein